MTNLYNFIYKISPDFFQNFMICMYNKAQYKMRYGGFYRKYRNEKMENRNFTKDELREYQKKRYKEFIEFAIENSEYYKQSLSGIPNASDMENILKLPILDKETLRENTAIISVKTKEKLYKAKTGGTTGKSLEILTFAKDNQERFAFLDDFRSRFGYALGKKTAWFSGKKLLTRRDIGKNRFWKTDYWHNVRYYSTFHINSKYLKFYLENLIEYKPEYLIGFPSTILDIAKYGLANGYSFPGGNTVKAILPTAETITPEMRECIETFFKSKIYDQYASSEGAPFIFECENGNLHLELQSGVFEVLDDNNRPANSGRLVVTSFTTGGTPLIRYEIGDTIALEDEAKTCNCGNNNPLVKELLGRIDDFVFSPDTGKINLGNVSNTLKDTKGIIRFQVIQNRMDEIHLLLVVDNTIYSPDIEKKFVENWRDRIGENMKMKIRYVNDIPMEKSGKYRIVKNNIKHLL